MIGIVTNIYRQGDPRRPDGEPPTPCLYVAVSGDREHPDPEQRQIDDLVCTYRGEPPPPLSMCRFTDEKVPDLIGPVGLDVTNILYDNFTYVTTTPNLGDTPWRNAISGGGAGADTGAQLPITGLGVTRIQSRNAAGAITEIMKDGSTFAAGGADAFWMQAKVRCPTFTDSQVWVGLGGPGDLYAVQLFLNDFYSSAWMLRAVNNVDPGVLVATATVPNSADFITADLVFAPGGFAALWIDGDGPYYTTTALPTGTNDLEPSFAVSTRIAAPKNLDVDLLSYWGITGALAHPETHELLTL